MPPKASASRDAEPKPKITSEQRKRMKEGKALRGEVSGKEATRPQHEETSMQSNALIDNSPMNPMAHHQVFVVRPVGTTENKGELAGYMGCENIEEFYDLCHALKDVLGSLFQHQEVCLIFFSNLLASKL